MENINDINEVIKLLDNYVKLNFLMRLLTSNSTKNSEGINSSVIDIDFSELGFSKEIAKNLGTSPSIDELKKYIDEITNLAMSASSQVFEKMLSLSNEMKESSKEYVEDKVSSYLKKVRECEEEYLDLVAEINKSTKEDNNSKTRTLGKMAKNNYNRIYEYNIIYQCYSNMYSYLNGMIRNPSSKK